MCFQFTLNVLARAQMFYEEFRGLKGSAGIMQATVIPEKLEVGKQKLVRITTISTIQVARRSINITVHKCQQNSADQESRPSDKQS